MGDQAGVRGSATRWRGRRLTALPAIGAFIITVRLAPALAASASSPAIRLSVTAGPPTTTTTVSGRGFGPQETERITIGATEVATTTTGIGGHFSKGIRVPASALPGPHPIVATGEASGLRAKATFT